MNEECHHGLRELNGAADRREVYLFDFIDLIKRFRGLITRLGHSVLTKCDKLISSRDDGTPPSLLQILLRGDNGTWKMRRPLG